MAVPGMSALRGKFHGVIDQIGDGLEQKIAVAVNRRLICRFDPKSDTLVLRDRVVEVADLAHQGAERDLAKPV